MSNSCLLRIIVPILALLASPAHAMSGEVRDAVTGLPVAGATVTLSGGLVHTDKQGIFSGEGSGNLRVRAPGYHRMGTVAANDDTGHVILLEPIEPHAVFLSLAALDDPDMVDRILALKRTSSINALVIDVKAESGELALMGHDPFQLQDTAHLARRAQTLKRVLQHMREQHMYAIARISVFKDDALARRQPALGLKTMRGLPLHGRDGWRWTNPDNEAVRAYNIAIALVAARAGFDEIQFDYVRFPTRKMPLGAAYSGDRRASINAFLSDARAALTPYNVFLSADVFGFASWDVGDTNIGQNLEDIAQRVDYICLMLYPSAFRDGLQGVPMPLDQPGQIVRLSLEKARQRTGLSADRFRPWLQAFRDHNFDGRPFGRAEIAAQVEAAEAFGASGWMLWHSKSTYDPGDLPPARPR
ncbi:MAG: GTP-binding protein [Alphaproteobacteria bacterium]|nr:GTP-binding protein [Alphaproteobacteria bacterium]